jgi:hypothetical protein
LDLSFDLQKFVLFGLLNTVKTRNFTSKNANCQTFVLE